MATLLTSGSCSATLAATAAELRKQKPASVSGPAWWPGGRAHTKTLSSFLAKTNLVACVKTASQLLLKVQGHECCCGCLWTGCKHHMSPVQMLLFSNGD